jgi:glycosyltransferase involved in cell wall biosynthesis
MRVLFLNYEYPPLGGGAANATSYILREFSKIPDLEVDLVTSSEADKFSLEKISSNIKIHKLPIGKNEKNLHFQSKKDILVYAWKAYFYSKKLAAKNKYDLTHSFFSVPCGFLSLLLKRKYGLPYIVSLRGADVPGYSDRFPLIYIFLTPLIRYIWKKADQVISNSQGLKELALKTNAGQVIGIIYNGIDIEQFRPSHERLNTEHGTDNTEQGAGGMEHGTQSTEHGTESIKHVIGQSGLKILCISRLTRRKGINYLIEAIGKMVEKYPNLSLQIVGEGDAKEELEKQAQGANLSPKIEFMGGIAHEKTPEIYNSADVFVLPSLNEGMSNTMLEALASGLPIITTDTGGSKELVQDGENGFIVKMKDSADIAEKIEKLMVAPELAQIMGEASRRRALEMSWTNVAKSYYGLYKTVK